MKQQISATIVTIENMQEEFEDRRLNLLYEIANNETAKAYVEWFVERVKNGREELLQRLRELPIEDVEDALSDIIWCEWDDVPYLEDSEISAMIEKRIRPALDEILGQVFSEFDANS